MTWFYLIGMNIWFLTIAHFAFQALLFMPFHLLSYVMPWYETLNDTTFLQWDRGHIEDEVVDILADVASLVQVS